MSISALKLLPSKALARFATLSIFVLSGKCSNLWSFLRAQAMRLRTTLLITALLSASPVWAYRPLHGIYQNTIDAPVVTRSVSTSLADKDGKLNSNWDTTIVLEQKDPREVARVDLAFSLLGNQNRTITVRRVVLKGGHSWKQGEQWEYRLQQDHLGWPGEATLVQVVSVTFTNGETWDSSNKPEQELQDFTTPDGKEKATLPSLPENNPNSPYIPPIVLPTGGGAGSSSSGTGYVPPVRPRVSPARPGFSRSVPPPQPTTPVPSQAQPSPIPGSSAPGSPTSPSIGTSPSTPPPPQSNPFPGILPPGSSTPGTNSSPSNGSVPVPLENR